ncbi:MAG: homoserine kinase [Methyloprofundus sp.]|nr:homoserine kinase [Methyloprofundus sp.]
MSVYTSLQQAHIERLIERYPLAPLVSFSGISAGIENTNYLVQTQQGDFILTLYEHFSAKDVAPYLALLQQLAHLEDYYPSPLVDSQKQLLQQVAHKPAALFKCLSGRSPLQATPQQCQSIAFSLAKLHHNSAHLKFNKPNPKGIHEIQLLAEKLLPSLSTQDADLLKDELHYQLKQTHLPLKQGLIHADLFKDNTLFVEHKLTGLLDFYAACIDYFLLDVAITLNDWCVTEQGIFDYHQQASFIHAYQRVHALNSQELAYLPLLLRRASLRFWVSRLNHKQLAKSGAMTQEKDPEIFKYLLLQHRQFYSDKQAPLE